MTRLIFVILFIFTSLAQFGQNKVQYRDFKWRFIQTKHFDVYFYKNGEVYAEFTAEVMEEFYKNIQANWNYNLKERVAIFVYNSHNDFKQSLIVDSYLPESIGGVTELFKNRIIVPFEGDYMKFDHVIKHELVHAIMNDLLYDGSIQNVISRRVSQPPLWFSEGLAEWEATGWDTSLDMAVRDLVINNNMPPIEYLEYVSPYQGGANAFKYISQRFGREKVAELLRKAGANFNFYTAFEKTLKISPEQFTEDWHRYLRKQYWPEIATREESNQVSTQLTKHKKDGSYINNAAAISPKGDMIAYLSNKGDGYMSIHLMDSFTGKDIKRLVKGNTTSQLDQMHWLNPGLSFSPDGKTLLFASFAGEKDLLNFVDVKSGDIKTMNFPLDGLFSPSFSPDGENIAFVGTLSGASDIYIYNLKSKDLTNITNDVYSDLDPVWSNDGKSIAFTSDRGANLTVGTKPYKFKMFNYNYRYKDIYTIRVQSQLITRITDTPMSNEGSPTFSPDDTFIAFTSDRSGINNIYFKNLSTNEDEYSISNLLTGAMQLDWSKDGSQLVFSSFFDSGYDIFSITSPLDKPKKEVEETHFIKTRNAVHFQTLSAENIVDSIAINAATSGKDFSRYNFSRVYQTQSKVKDDELKKEPVFLTDNDVKFEGKYKVRDYDEDWSVDFVNGIASYDNIYGVNAFYMFSISEKAGKERLSIQTDLVLNFKNADLVVQYAYLPKQINYIFSGFHLSNRFSSNGRILTYRNFGFSAVGSLPFNRFERLDVGTQFVKYELSDNFANTLSSAPAIIGTTSYVYDNSRSSYTGPIDGMRLNVTGMFAPEVSDNSAAFMTFKVDIRKYFNLGSGFSFAMRFAGGASQGLREVNGVRTGEMTFRLGGVNFWVFNSKYNNEENTNSSSNPDISTVDQLSFSEFVTPLRGAYYNGASGSKFALNNFEIRFPFIDYLIARVPPIPLQGIRGSFFSDFGYAWDKPLDKLRLFKDGEPQDILWGYGFGIQAYVPFFGGLFRFDKAWRYGSAYPDPVYYFSFGADF